MADRLVDFEALTPEQRLQLIECLLGLLPSGNGWESRASYLAFQVAADFKGHDRFDDALERLEAAKPGFFDNVQRFARETRGLVL